MSTPRRPPEPNAAVLLIGLGRRVRGQVEAALAEHGIAYRHLSALGHLANDQGISYSELARRAAVTVPSMQSTLARLEDLGAIRQEGDGGQGRRARLEVTAAGRELLAAGKGALAKVESDLIAALPKQQREAFMAQLLTLFATAGREG